MRAGFAAAAATGLNATQQLRIQIRAKAQAGMDVGVLHDSQP